MADLTPQEWSDIVDAIHYAADEVEYDLDSTKNSDFYTPEERSERMARASEFRRLAKLIEPMTESEMD